MADQLRIVHVVHPQTDELKRYVIALATGLRDRRVETLVAGPMERRFRDDLSQRGIRWANLPIPQSLLKRDQAAVITALRRLLTSVEPALVHAHGFFAAMPALGSLPPRSPRPGFVYSPHTSVARSSARPSRAERSGRGRLLTASDAVIVATAAERDALREAVPRGGDEALRRVTVIHPGVEGRRTSSYFDPGEKRHSVGLRRDAAIVAVAAPLEEGVPFEDLAGIASLVGRALPSVEFALIGDGPRAAALEDLIHRQGLFGSTVFLRNRHDAGDIISTCNLLVALCDDANGISYALEALARGIRVVANDLPGLREVFGETPLVPLIAVSERERFARAIAAKLEEMSETEEGLRTENGFVWGLKDVLASEDQYDLDAPGLDPKAQKEEEKSDLDLLLERHSMDNMIRRTFEVYNQVLSG